jgi:sugar lactone lactonase YvrE
VHCSTTSGAGLDCKIVSPANGHPAANGVLLTEDGKTLLVNEIVEATTTVYDVDPVTKMLTVKKKVVRLIEFETCDSDE